ncbi:GNAT family N-acetyltransferase [Paenibacillus pasadenensis]|uniref:Acetyltransferase, GNAT family n=1 Tax=Paenibacillus pasadenensis TaxID=217090 RepID=A0A2N5N0H9_9BACL|nr:MULTISPECIES: GNAT family N-acetyltransferase [Paenibacillus]PLT43843.1 acetyltransferase, GNAT family [Paenibacillus pasadenensis]QGG54440.1 GNAT family N-acetyltransferase [Paenibacillus sp. B01]
MGELYRIAVEKDAPRLQQIVYGAYEQIRELKLSWPAAHADEELIRSNIREHECYVLELDGELAATITLSKGEEAKAITDLPFLKWFAVAPELQSRGVGSKLLSWVEQEVLARRLGAEAVTLATAERHPWLLSMYERKGYERYRAIDFGNGDGTMHLLRKRLQPQLQD